MRRIVLILSVILILAGCSDYRQISINDVTVGSFRFNGTSSATIVLVAKVDNPTGHAVSLEEIDAVVLREGKDFIGLSLEEKASAAPFSSSEISIPVRASVLDPVAIITAGLDFESWDLDNFVVDGKIVLASGGGMKKTLSLKKVPLKQLMEEMQ